MNNDKVAIARCSDYSKNLLEDSVGKIFSFFGGPQKIIRPGQKVLLKPNLISSPKIHKGGTTHPQIIETLIKVVKKCNAQVFLSDSPAFGSAIGVSRECGIEEICKRYDVPIIEFKRKKVDTRNPGIKKYFYQNINSKLRKKISRLSTVTESVRDFDIIINLPKLKSHAQMLFTGAIKNLYGCISGKVKVWRHFLVNNNVEIFSLFVLSIYDIVRPEFTIVDAVDVLESRDSQNGGVKRRGILFGGINCVSIDTVISHYIGQEISDVPILNTARKYGYGITDINDITVFGDKIQRMLDFRVPKKLMPISFSLGRIFKSIFKQLRILIKEK